MTLLWVSLVLGFIVSLLQLDWPFPSEDAFAWWFVAVVAFTYLFFAVLILLVSWRHNWARLLVLSITVIGALVMLIPWPGIDFDWNLSDLIAQIGLLALDGVALFWLFTGAGAAWFATKEKEAF